MPSANQGWTLDCDDQVAITAAVAVLDAKPECKADNPPTVCDDSYHIMQAHHDHCLHDQLPIDIEVTLHDYEHYYDDCFVERQYDENLSACPEVDCTDSVALTSAVQKLQSGCDTEELCAESECAAAIKTVLMAHDTCSEDDLPNNIETALHEHEGPCEAQLCNTASAAFNPYDQPCQVNTEKDAPASGFGIQEAFLVTALLLAILPSL